MNLLPEEGNDGKDRNWKNVMDRVKRCDAGWSAPKSLKVMRKTMVERIESRRRSFVCFLLFILLLPSVSPLSMSESSLPGALVRIPVGKSVFSGTLLQVGHILSLVFAPCAELQKCICRISKVYLSAPSFRSLIRMAKVASMIVSLPPVLLLRYLPLPSLSPATQSPSYLITMVRSITF